MSRLLPLADTVAPSEFLPRTWRPRAVQDSTWQSAEWQPDELGRLMLQLSGAGQSALTSVSTEDLLAAWHSTVSACLDAGSADEALFRCALARTSRLSPEGLAAGLDAVLRGLLRPHADRLATALERTPSTGAPGPSVILLASNLPGLAAQPLLRALLERRPVLLKSASDEPLFAPRFVAELIRRLPALSAAVAATTWRGGDRRLEDVVFAQAGQVIAYGTEATLGDLAPRLRGRLLAHGPRASLAVIAADADLEAAAQGVAADVALFDQRGCLSVQAVYVLGALKGAALKGARRFATLLVSALSEASTRLPAGPATAAELAGVQLLRAEAEIRGLPLEPSDSVIGTVVLEERPLFLPSPGRRTVRVHNLDDPAELLSLLSPWKGRLQGVATSGTIGESMRQALTDLRVTRIAPAGELQRPDATWENRGEASRN
ncbi:MAG: acyl-CoA reductase [Acidobacteriota bacterium]